MARRAATLDFEAVLTGALSPPPGSDPDAEAMIDATSILLGQYGLRRWSMDDVAAQAGLARATVYRRFESRDRLVRAALIRDARRFFTAVAAAVEAIPSLADKVVEGLVVGLELIRWSPVPSLLEADPVAALSLLTSDSILLAGRRALVERYESLTGGPVPAADRDRVEAAAEALIRLALSLLVTPGVLTGTATGPPHPATDGASLRPDARSREDMRRALASVVHPLLGSTGSI